MEYVIIGLLLIGIIILIIKLSKKSELDTNQRDQLNQQVNKLKTDQAIINQDIYNKREQLIDIQNQISRAEERYSEAIGQKAADLDAFFDNQKELRQSEMDTDFENLWREKNEALEAKYKNIVQSYELKEQQLKEQTDEIIAAAQQSQANILAETQFQQQRFEGLLEPLKQYEKEQQERLFYTIQVPDEYKDDINFLITTVSQKVQHPDIINKLVWAEYVKPYIDETFKRANIKDEPGIYKITSLESGKCYIGKSTNMKKRLADHFKSSIGIKTIADQAVHHEIWRTGFWNWTIEPIIYCDKDELNDLEKYYIEFFKSQEFGFNKNQGGGG